MATQLDLADAQFTGFAYARGGFLSIVGLVESMGLKRNEWIKLKAKNLKVLTEIEIEEIDSYFAKDKK